MFDPGLVWLYGPHGRGGANVDGSEISDVSVAGTYYGVYLANDRNVTVTQSHLTGSYYAGQESDDEADTWSHDTIKGNTLDAPSACGIYVPTMTPTGVYIYTRGQATGFAATLTKNTANSNRYGLYSQFRAKGSANTATANTQLNCHKVTCPQP